MKSKKIVEIIKQNFDVNAIFAESIASLVDEKNIIESTKFLIDQKAKPFVKWVGGKRQLLG
jgi:hypothetical protein